MYDTHKAMGEQGVISMDGVKYVLSFSFTIFLVNLQRIDFLENFRKKFQRDSEN